MNKLIKKESISYEIQKKEKNTFRFTIAASMPKLTASSEKSLSKPKRILWTIKIKAIS